MSLANKNTRMVDAFGEAQFEHLSLKTTLQKILQLEAEHIIQLHLLDVEHSNTDQTTQQGVTC